MDPNATLASIDHALARVQFDEAAGVEVDEACEDLWRWLGRGGFEPDWKRYPIATGYYRSQEPRLKALGVMRSVKTTGMGTGGLSKEKLRECFPGFKSWFRG
jgi:hypothetical protein